MSDYLDSYKKIRQVWKINPKTRVNKKKNKDRQREKQEFKKQLMEEDYE